MIRASRSYSPSQDMPCFVCKSSAQHEPTCYPLPWWEHSPPPPPYSVLIISWIFYIPNKIDLAFHTETKLYPFDKTGMEEGFNVSSRYSLSFRLLEKFIFAFMIHMFDVRWLLNSWSVIQSISDAPCPHTSHPTHRCFQTKCRFFMVLWQHP